MVLTSSQQDETVVEQKCKQWKKGNIEVVSLRKKEDGRITMGDNVKEGKRRQD